MQPQSALPPFLAVDEGAKPVADDVTSLGYNRFDQFGAGGNIMDQPLNHARCPNAMIQTAQPQPLPAARARHQQPNCLKLDAKTLKLPNFLADRVLGDPCCIIE